MLTPDILLIQPSARCSAYPTLMDVAAKEPPIWVSLLARYLLNRGVRVEILDADALDLPSGQIGQIVADMRPRFAVLVVYGHHPSASTQTMPGARAALQAIRDAAPDVRTAIVGGHVSALPERTLREEPVDFVIEGEGFTTLEGLARSEDNTKVPGLWWEDGDFMYHAPSAPLLQDLDALAPPPWPMLPMHRYRAHNWHVLDWPYGHSGYASVYTTLGCPYHCAFCCIQSPFRSGQDVMGIKPTVNSYRRWSPEAFRRSVNPLAEIGVTSLKIIDEMFVLHEGHVTGICEQLIQMGSPFNIWAYARVDTVKPRMLDTLRRAGIRWLCLGIEAADSTVRDGQDKGFTDARIFETVRAIQAAGIYVIGNYIVGLPHDTKDTMARTLELALDLRCEWSNFYSAMAYPGSALYTEAVRAGTRLPTSWAGYAQLARETTPLPTATLTSEEVLAFRDHAFRTYFTDPGFLGHLRRTFGDEAVTQVQAVVARPLPRDILDT